MGLSDLKMCFSHLYHSSFPGSQVEFLGLDLEQCPCVRPGSAPANELCAVVVNSQHLGPASLQGAVLGGP